MHSTIRNMVDLPDRFKSPSMEDLPVEIIQTVFLELCPTLAVFPLRKHEPRLLVTQVCSRWRAISLSTPALWANYYVHFHSSHSHPQPQSDLIRTWISRAAESPLSITICGPSLKTSPMISDVVFPVIHRCSVLLFCINTATLDRLLALPPKSLHMLQDITIIVEDDAQVASSTPFATAFELCPQLHTFEYATIGRCHVENLAIANFNVPWHQLTTLRLCSPSILAHKCLDILPQCTSLRKCSIDISPIDDLTLQTIVGRSNCPTVLPYLHALCIKFDNNDSYFLKAFHLPRLRKFKPMGLTYLVPWSLSAVQSVLSDTIKELDLSGFDFPENLPETLALVPNLETLQLASDPSQEYPEVTHALGEGALSPRLTTLWLGFVDSFDSLFDMIEARIEAARIDRGIAAFVRVVVLNRGNSPLNEARLVALTEAGVQIRPGYPR